MSDETCVNVFDDVVSATCLKVFKRKDKFSGVFYKPWDLAAASENGCDRIYITRVIYNAPATIVFWSDGTKTVAKCSPRDTYVKETGLSICILKKLCGSMQVKNLFEDWVDADSATVTLTDVRRKNKHKS